MLKFEWFGVKEMLARLRKISEKFPDEVAKAMYAEAQIEMTESKKRVPVDRGVLRASGTVHEPERNGKNISVTMSYGGAAIDYAVYVHENPDAFHKVGQWKYLESVLNESRPYMAGRIAARLKLSDAKSKKLF